MNDYYKIMDSNLYQEGYKKGYSDGVQATFNPALRWKDVKEQPPMIHTNVLIYIPDHGDLDHYAIGYLETDDNFYYNETDEHIDCIDMERVSHWRELPKPPK